MISLILPIGGDYPFYVEMCLANIADTCGIPMSEFDMVILTGKNISDRMQRALDKAAKTYKFRVLAAPIPHDIHLNMLDWVIEQDLEDWIFTTHMDMFWEPNDSPWLLSTVQKIKKHPDAYALCLTHKIGGYRFKLDGKPLTPAYDHIGAYNRHAILKHGWTFLWGTLEQRSSISIINMSNTGRLTFNDDFAKHFNIPVRVYPHSYLDGSCAIGLELAINYPEKIILVDNVPAYHHLWCYIRPINTINKQGSIVNFDIDSERFHQETYRWAIHAWICSLFLDQDEYKDKILPLKTLTNIFGPINELHPVKKIFQKYANPSPNCIGLDNDFNVEFVKLKDTTVYARKFF